MIWFAAMKSHAVTSREVWRTSNTALTASAGRGQLQTGAHGIPSVERFGATVSEWTRSGIKPARSSPSVVVVHAAAARYVSRGILV